MGVAYPMNTVSEVMNAKLAWLEQQGYLIMNTSGGVASYTLTKAGNAYLNDKKED